MTRVWGDTRPIFYGNATERNAFDQAGDASGALFWDYDDETLYQWTGAAWVSVGWKLGDILTVSKSGDGDYTTLTAALAAAGAGDTVLFDIGTYAEAITIPDDVSLIGVDRGNCIISQSANQYTVQFSAAGTNYLADCTILNTKVDAGDTGSVYVPAGVVDLTIESVEMDGANAGAGDFYGLWTAHTSGSFYVIDCTIDGSSYAWYHNGSGAWMLQGALEQGIETGGGASGSVSLVSVLGGGTFSATLIRGWLVDSSGHLQAVNGSELILDADGDTSLSAPTDDQIDIEVAGSDIGLINSDGLDIKGLQLSDSTELTIAAGVVTRTQSYHRIDTQDDDPTDDLDTINGGEEGDLLVITPESGARTVVVKHNTGNIRTFTGADISMTAAYHHILLFRAGTNWSALGNF